MSKKDIKKANPLANSYTTSKKINHPHYDVTKPNEQHQFDKFYVS